MEWQPIENENIKTLARLLIDRMANPDLYPDMNDSSVDWQVVYNSMRNAYEEEDGHMGSVLAAGLMSISAYDPWD